MIRRLFILPLAIILAGGCAGRPRRPSGLPPSHLRNASLKELEERLCAAAGEISTLKADFTAALTDSRVGKKRTCRGIIALERPDRLRMKASRVMLPILFDLLVVGDRVTLYVPREKTVYRGREGEGGFANASMLADLFWGCGEGKGTIDFVEAAGPRYILYSVLRGEGGARLARKVFFDREGSLDPVRYQYFDARGRAFADLRCGDFFSPRGLKRAIPRRVTVTDPSGGSGIALRLEKVRINVPLDPRLFAFEPPAGAANRPLGEYP